MDLQDGSLPVTLSGSWCLSGKIWVFNPLGCLNPPSQEAVDQAIALLLADAVVQNNGKEQSLPQYVRLSDT